MKSKVIGGMVFLLAVAIGAGIYFTLSNLDSLIAGLIEKHGSEAVGTSVQVSGVHLKVREGSGAIDNLSIANPPGYSDQNIFSLGNITLNVDTGSLRQEPIVIDEIRVSAPVVLAEFNDQGVSNIDEIRKHVQSYIPSGGDAGGGESQTGQAKRIRIRKFTFEKGRLEVDTTALGQEKRVIDLPEISVANVGGDGGALPDQIAKEVISTVAKRVVGELAKSEVQKLINDHLDGSLGEKAKGVLDKIIK